MFSPKRKCVLINHLHGAGGGGDTARVSGREVVRERQAVEVDEGVAHGVHEGVRRRPPAGVPDAALIEPRRRGEPMIRVSAVREGGDEEAEEEEERVDGGCEQSGGQGGEQVERLHCCRLDRLVRSEDSV